MSKTVLGSILLAGLTAAAVLGAHAAPAPAPAAGEEAVRFFSTQVRPVLEGKCLTCHSGEKPQAGLRLTSRAAILKGGSSGPAVSLAKPAESLLVAAINYRGREMPPQGKLPQAQID